MSATRDKNQKVTFVYQNLHNLYRQGLEAAKAAVVPPVAGGSEASASKKLMTGVIRGKVIKSYEPVELLAKRREAVAPLASSEASQRQAIESLQQNLKTLTDLHSRLRFMLKELEELVKE